MPELLRPVVNATGVLLHTNLGRAPTPDVVPGPARWLTSEAATAADLGVGSLLARVCGAEDGLVVNNCAAGVLLVLRALVGDRGGVAVSRGELVEIGGGFRIPEVVQSCGARLVEVGTTNKTRLSDYAAVRDRVGLLLKVHTSNYRITGFTESTGVEALATLGLPVVVDLGSGLVDATTPWIRTGPPPWLRDEPAVRQTLDAGADLVVFSGDKLFGSAQAGIIVGRRSAVEACRADPLAPVLAPDRLVLAAVQESALAYLRRDLDGLPLWRMATATVAELQARAEALGVGTPLPLDGAAGGGTLPDVAIPSFGVAVPGDVRARLRAADPPIVARAADGRTLCDLRTVCPADDAHLAASLVAATGR